MNNFIATGKSGTIGRHFGIRAERIAIDLSQEIWNEKNLNISNGDIVIHCAAIVGNEAVLRNEKLAYQVNVSATRKLAQVARKKRASRFIYVSTAHVYANKETLITELDPVAPQNLYAEQKYEAETSVVEELSGSNTEFCIARVFSVLDWDVKAFTLGGSIRKLLDSRSGELLTNCDDVRDFLTPRTVANSLIAIAGEPGLIGVVNVCSGQGVTVRTAAQVMFEKSGIELPPEKTVAGNSLNPILVGDNSKLKDKLPDLDLSWNPSFFDLNQQVIL